MKVLIMTVTAGFGHHATAKAIGDMCKSKGLEVEIVDVYEYINKAVYDTIDKGYLFTTKYAPDVYRFFYTQMERKDRDDIIYDRLNLIRLVNKLGKSKFGRLLNEFNPDVIVCTHIFSALLADVMKRMGKLDAVSFGVITDYTIHPYWENIEHLEYIVTATELLSHLATKKGIKESKQLPLGIPIHPKFNKSISKEDARRELGLDPDRPVILVMGGSMGYSNGKRILKSIDKTGMNFQIIAVCGRNEKQYKSLIKYRDSYKGNASITVIGFATNVDVLMDASDCIVTKPGGLTVSESLAKNLPMILVDPIPGQEERNVEFLLNNGIASMVTKTYPLDEAIYQMFSNEVRINQINETIKKISHPNATEDLVDFIINNIE